VAAGGGCPWSAGTASSSFSSWITINSGFSGDGNGTVSFTVSPNTNEAARTGALIVAGQRVNITQSGTGPDCALTSIGSGQTINGALEVGDCRSPNRGARYADRYTFNAAAGQQAVITSTSGPLDTFLTLIGPNGAVILNDDDSGGDTNSRIPGGAGALTLLLPGTYTIEASTYDDNQTGSYALSLSLTGGVANPIDDARVFVRQQYLDFLNREPDAPGWDHWTREITVCNDATRRQPGESEAQCTDRKRVNTSGAFFLSPEFQNTGYFVVRVYRGTLGRMPQRAEWAADARRVSQGIVVADALAPDVINGNKRAYADEFVQRGEFRAVYDSLNNDQYVDRLFAVTQVTPTSAERAALVNGLTSGAETRASVLFKVVDGTQTTAGGQLVFETAYGKAFYDQQFNPAFVLMEYFGYLQRDPDAAGFAFWLAKLNSYGNFTDAEMVKAFIVSPEYRSRFGQP